MGTPLQLSLALVRPICRPVRGTSESWRRPSGPSSVPSVPHHPPDLCVNLSGQPLLSPPPPPVHGAAPAALLGSRLKIARDSSRRLVSGHFCTAVLTIPRRATGGDITSPTSVTLLFDEAGPPVAETRFAWSGRGRNPCQMCFHLIPSEKVAGQWSPIIIGISKGKKKMFSFHHCACRKLCCDGSQSEVEPWTQYGQMWKQHVKTSAKVLTS